MEILVRIGGCLGRFHLIAIVAFLFGGVRVLYHL